MATSLATNVNKTAKRHTKVQVITAVFENGVLRPLSQVWLPEREEFTIVVRSKNKSIAKQMYGLFKSQNHSQLDTIIESEDWL